MKIKTIKWSLLSLFVIFLGFCILDEKRQVEEYRRNEYRVWEKATGNPNKLTFEEFQVWKGL